MITREAAFILEDLGELIESHQDEYPRGALEAIDITVRALDPTQSAGYPVEIEEDED